MREVKQHCPFERVCSGTGYCHYHTAQFITVINGKREMVTIKRECNKKDAMVLAEC